MKNLLKNSNEVLIKILNGTTIAIVVALIPNAICATFLKPLSQENIELATTLLHIVQVFQYFTPIMAGFLIALQFKLNPLQSACVGGAAYIASGAWAFVNATIVGADTATGLFQLKGIGDVINIMFISGVAVGIVKLISPKLGSLNLVLLPIIVGCGVGYIGTLTLPFVSGITAFIGNIINSFTTLQPVIASILISMSFAILVISPISTVAIGLAIGLSGISSAAAGMGVTAAAAFLVFATARVNKPGVPIAIGLGGMKMMMTNLLQHPVMAIPVAIVAAISSVPVALLEMSGTPATAGFGIVGLVSPLAALEAGNINALTMLIFWIVVPFLVGCVVEFIFRKVIKIYDKEIFVFNANN